jgi:secreted peptidase, family M23
MSVKKKSNKNLRGKWLFKYRVIIMNENTLEDVATFRLNRLNVFIYSSLFAILMIVLTSLVIIYSPLRQYILGFSEADLRKQIVDLTFRTDSLQQRIGGNDAYFSSLQKVLTGDIHPDKVNKDSLLNAVQQIPVEVDIQASEEEMKLRHEVAEEERYNVFDQASNKAQKSFFPPCQGTLSSAFKSDKRHYGVDITAPEGTPVRAITNGTIIFSEWSAQTGFVIVIEHPNNFISVYKHNASLVKKQGDKVSPGEVVAKVGNTGELSTGTHLHFELWHEGYPVDPLNYMTFK